MNYAEQLTDPVFPIENRIENLPHAKSLLSELRAGLIRFRDIADSILRQSNVRLKPPEESDFSLQRNFFSFLFLYSFYRARIPESRRILYTSMLQCQRGMVTGCDNLLDDEYKKTLDTDLPESGFRIRSVIDIMVSDRVLFQLLTEASLDLNIPTDRITAAAAASMKTLTRSAAQEASEEGGITAILKPDDLLQSVHRYKTGLLFTCPWDIPLTLETMDESKIAPLLDALYRIGMGCQIMDDMVDFMTDLKRKRHNYLIALIYHGSNPDEKRRLQDLIDHKTGTHGQADPAAAFPDSLHLASEAARHFLESGLAMLFSKPHQTLVNPSIQFLIKRLGVSRLYGNRTDES